MPAPTDRDLGMDRPIARRDFLNGAAVALTGSLIGRSWLEAAGLKRGDQAVSAYPPALTGMRGSHPGSFEVAHRLREGPWPDRGAETGESFDLVVVGGGLSGLAAAHFFRTAAGRDARILVLDNHDDFGGHAKRNEFRHGDRLLIGYGGTQSIDTPSGYSAEAKSLLTAIGIEVERFYRYFEQDLFKSMGLSRAVFFDKETFGADRLVAGEGSRPWSEFLADAPLSAAARRDIARLYEAKTDSLPGLDREQKLAKLRRVSYREFLLKVALVHEDVLPFFQARPHGFWALGIDVLPALDALLYGYPGAEGMDIDAGSERRTEPYIFHFPDGNASVARLLVRSLVPSAVPGASMEDVVTARVDYARLDQPGAPVRIRLNSTAVLVRHRGPAQNEVEIRYVRDGRTFRVRARQCVLACYNAMIPQLCPELPPAQQAALAEAVRAPLVYTNVLIRDWTSFARLGIQGAHCPGGYHSSFSLDFPVSIGSYRFPRSPEEPMVLHLVRAPLRPGIPALEQHRAGRHDLLSASFETFERSIRDQLGRALTAGGFDPAREIEAITVNRWPHGYAYSPNSLYDPDWKEAEKPWVVGRARFGRIAIANSDAGADAYTNVAFDQAHRAVSELTGLGT
jgi:spermidine dehydrogenase